MATSAAPAAVQPEGALPLRGLALVQVFLDVVESVNLLVNSNGTVVRSEVVGALKMRAYLSGMVRRGRGCCLHMWRPDASGCLSARCTSTAVSCTDGLCY